MDEQLIRLLSAVAQGDQSAFERLYKLTAAKLYAVSLQLLQRRDWAEDAVQEAYVRIWNSAGDYQQEKGSVVTWMVSIVRYRALDMLRAAKTRDEKSDDGYEEVHEHSPEREFYQERDRVQIDDCMDHLEEEQKNAIQLAYFRGFTHSEVCSRLNSPLGSVKSWIRRGLQRLKRCLES
jgi:RNA polymerase sigma factor (sigma-70 family)